MPWIIDEEDHLSIGQYFTSAPRSYARIPTEDCEAYTLYPQYNWVYNKLELYKNLGYEVHPHGVTPTKFPVVSKPITNLYGLSVGTRILHDWSEDYYEPGHIWMAYYSGYHYSTDYVVIRGVVVNWKATMLAYKDRLDSFTGFRIGTLPDLLHKHNVHYIKQNLASYTGILNIEQIGSKILEVHLRMSAQFIDLFGGDSYLEQVSKLYNGQGFDTRLPLPERGISLVYRVPRLYLSVNYEPEVIDALRQEVSSIQMCVEPGVPLEAYDNMNDSNSYRIAVINCVKKSNCQKVLHKLKEVVKCQKS